MRRLVFTAQPSEVKLESSDAKAVEEMGQESVDKLALKDQGKTAGQSSRPPSSGDDTKAVHDPDDVAIVPDVTASWVSKALFLWLDKLLSIGYRRPLESSDLYKLDGERQSGALAAKLVEHFEARRIKAEAWNRRLASGEYQPSRLRKRWWRFKAAHLGAKHANGRQAPSLAGAIFDTFRAKMILGGMAYMAAALIQSTQPLLARRIISYAQEAYDAATGVEGQTDPGNGQGVALAIGIFLMAATSAFAFAQWLWVAARTGMFTRAALITATYSRALKLSGSARISLTNSRLVSLISTDVSRIDVGLTYLDMSYGSLAQLIVIFVILLAQLGASALPGVALTLSMIPLQAVITKILLKHRRAALVSTDERVKLTSEMISGLKVLRYFAWEGAYLDKLDGVRKEELAEIRQLLYLRALDYAIAMGLPMISAVISLTTYSLTHEQASSATIFTALSLFYILRLPAMMLPMATGMIADGKAAIDRITEIFTAETIEKAVLIDSASEWAVEVTDAWFRFESRPAVEVTNASSRFEGRPDQADTSQSPASTDASDRQHCQLRNVNLRIPRGSLVAFVGAVGAGKSALLQALIGEMKMMDGGSVTLGGSVGYCAQQAWLLSATVQQNILFGRPFDAKRYRKVVSDACLEADLAMLPHGDQTQIGEKGITLSGGQKQRVNIARALYFDSDILLYDDPLSAVDAHVGKHLFEHAIRDAPTGKTRLLVTHALHFLHQVDYIYCIEDGEIAEQGTYAELTSRAGGTFQRWAAEFGGKQTEKEEVEIAKEQDAIDGGEAKGEQKSGKHVLMQEEERLTGSVANRSWRGFFNAANGRVLLPALLIAFTLAQATSVTFSYTLVWWQDGTFATFTRNDYFALFAGLAIAVSLLQFALGVVCSVVFSTASRNLHAWSIRGVMHSPTRWFDVTPAGRILSRFTKDLDTLDNSMSDAFRLLIFCFGAIVSSVVLIVIVQRWFLIALAVISVAYAMVARYYRQSSRELKRLDNLARSNVYAHLSESLTGLATIRAYGVSASFKAENERRMDLGNRATFLVNAAKSWLQLRTEIFGSVLSFCVALIVVALRSKLSPAQIGVSLSYILSVVGTISYMIKQATELENDMNSVERLLYYSHSLEQEAPRAIRATDPPATWPANGAISFNNVVMAYRPGLPAVLKGISMQIKAGEKIGLVGRTGSGKSSIMVSLFRMVELMSGSIEIDGVDISKIGLETLRSRLSLIPQDPLLFAGTIRSNLDPFGEYDDAKLNDALRRSWLVDRDEMKGKARFSLDTVIEDEGLNLSVGERSLVSLARALVRDAQIVLLDEATASVDYETDAAIQETIASEFSDKTMIIVAHRLLTVCSCDRICVMDAGQIAELDTPAALFEQRGIFHSMCERSNISLQTIQQAHAARERGHGVVLKDEVKLAPSVSNAGVQE